MNLTVSAESGLERDYSVVLWLWAALVFRKYSLTGTWVSSWCCVSWPIDLLYNGVLKSSTSTSRFWPHSGRMNSLLMPGQQRHCPSFAAG